jgi:DNA replication protein DnaC
LPKPPLSAGGAKERLGEAQRDDDSNAVLRGPNGIGKTMIAQNIAHQAVIQGHTAIFTSAGQLFSELAAIDSAIALKYRLSRYARPALLVIDEVGYLS